MKPTKTQALWFLAEGGSQPWYNPRTRELMYDSTTVKGCAVVHGDIRDGLNSEEVRRLNRVGLREQCRDVLGLKENQRVDLIDGAPKIVNY